MQRYKVELHTHPDDEDIDISSIRTMWDEITFDGPWCIMQDRDGNMTAVNIQSVTHVDVKAEDEHAGTPETTQAFDTTAAVALSKLVSGMISRGYSVAALKTADEIVELALANLPDADAPRTASESMEDVQQLVTLVSGVRALPHGTLLEVGDKRYAQVRGSGLTVPGDDVVYDVEQMVGWCPMPWRVIRHG